MYYYRVQLKYSGKDYFVRFVVWDCVFCIIIRDKMRKVNDWNICCCDFDIVMDIFIIIIH